MTSLDLVLPPKNSLFITGCSRLIEKLKENNEKELIPYLET
jgi:hypothetical protein